MTHSEHDGERWLKADGMPALPEEAPTNLALVYVGEYVPETVLPVLQQVKNHDVVVLARGGVAASLFAATLADHTGRVWVVNRLNPSAWTIYLRWLGNMAKRYPQAEVTHVVAGLNPQPGSDQGLPLLIAGVLGLEQAMELAPHTLVDGEDEASLRHLCELWLEIPLDAVSHWMQGEDKASGFDMASAAGTLRIEPIGLDDEGRMARFHVYRRDSGEEVGFVHDLPDGEIVGGFDCDVMSPLGPLPEGSQIMLERVQFTESSTDREAAERLEAGPQPQMTTPNEKEEADDIFSAANT